MYLFKFVWFVSNKLIFFLLFSQMEVFPKFHPVPYSKKLTFYRTEPFSIDAYYTTEPTDPNRNIGKCFHISSHSIKVHYGDFNYVRTFKLWVFENKLIQ